MNQYFNTSLSRGKWEKQRAQTVAWWDQQLDADQKPYQRDHVSKPISLPIIEAHLEGGTFDYATLGLFDPRCDWLDAEVHVIPKFHVAGADGTALTFQVPTTLGESFPLVPRLDREGQVFNSFQILLQNRILTLRTSLVSSSHEFDSEHWFQNMRSFVSECVSLIDNTLHQLYFKAQYAPPRGWKFDAKKLGERHGRRLSDKLKWVFQITGNPLNADEELRRFEAIKGLRNHLQHFDPPCLCFTLEHDVVGWVNAMSAVAHLAWKMRRCMGSPLSVPLIQMLLAPEVEFAPEDPSRTRVSPAPEIGYAGTRW